MFIIFIKNQYFGQNAISGVLSNTLLLYKSLDKDESPEREENDYSFIHNLLKVLTLVAKPLEVAKSEEYKVQNIFPDKYIIVTFHRKKVLPTCRNLSIFLELSRNFPASP